MCYTNKKCEQIKREFLDCAGLARGYIVNKIYHVDHNGKETDFYINQSGFLHFVINGKNVILKNDGCLRIL